MIRIWFSFLSLAFVVVSWSTVSQFHRHFLREVDQIIQLAVEVIVEPYLPLNFWHFLAFFGVFILHFPCCKSRGIRGSPGCNEHGARAIPGVLADRFRVATCAK